MPTNLGRIRNFLSGITGVTPGSVASIQMQVNQRDHSIQLNCTGINYTGGVALVPTIVTAGGFTNTTGTVRLNVVNGVPTSATYVAGNSAGATTSTVLSVPDPTGAAPIVLTCTAAGTGVLGNATFTVGTGTPGPIPPATLITSLRLLVNSVTIRDISVPQLLAVLAAKNYVPQYGSLPIFFTEPSMNFLRDNELTSWDLWYQSSFQLQIGISSSVTSPGITGSVEFDFSRNARPGNAAQTAMAIKNGTIAPGSPVGTPIPFVQIISQHSQTIPITAGRFDITTLPWVNPITALWLIGSVPGNIYQVELLANGNNMIYQATAQQMCQAASENGFQLGNNFYVPTAGGGFGGGSVGTVANQPPTSLPNGLLAASPWVGPINGPYTLDGAVLFAPDLRPWKALRNTSPFILRVYSNVSQNLTVISEVLPGAYSG
jgi:hypothetical protein